jgi:hypothetical protein
VASSATLLIGCGSGDTSSKIRADESGLIEGADDVGLRLAMSDGKELWFAGGIAREGDVWRPISSIARLDDQLRETLSTDLPLGDGQMLAARWIGRVGGEVVVVGLTCPISQSDPPGCLDFSPDSRQVMFSVTDGGEVRRTDIRGLEHQDSRGTRRDFEVVGRVDDRLVAYTDDDSPGGAEVPYRLYDISLTDGSATEFPDPFALEQGSSVQVASAYTCASSSSLYAFARTGGPPSNVFPAGDPPTTEIRVRSVSLREPTGSAASWSEPVVVELNGSFPIDQPLPVCSHDDDVFVVGGPGRAAFVVQVLEAGSPIEPVVVDLEARPDGSVQLVDDRLIVTAFVDGLADATEAVVYERTPGGSWSVLARLPANMRGQAPRVLLLADTLIDVSPGLRINDNAGGSTFRTVK